MASAKAYIQNSNMYPSFGLMITSGLSRVDPRKLNPMRRANTLKLKHLKQFEALKEFINSLKDNLTHSKTARGNIKGWVSTSLVLFKTTLTHSLISPKLICAAKGAQQVDTNSMKKSLSKLLPDNLTSPDNMSLQNIVKTQLGFHHPVTACLLCPISKDYRNPEYILLLSTASDSLLTISLSRDMAKLREGTEALSIGDYHNFMYEDFKGDLCDASVGLLQSYILIQVHFFCLLPAASGYLPLLGLGLQGHFLLAKHGRW